MKHREVTEKIIGAAMKVHRTLGPGFLESVYQNALAHELRRAGLGFDLERAIDVYYEGIVVGQFVADVLVEGAVLVENKAVTTLVNAHEAQLVNYLTATGIDVGLLLNFGAASLQYKRKARIYNAAPAPPEDAGTLCP
jgi:GxxExxY protein